MTELQIPYHLQDAGLRIYFTEDPQPEKHSSEYLLTALFLYSGHLFTEQDILREPGKKPQLRRENLHFSVTHSGGIWMVCVAPLCVGLDLQVHKDKYTPGVVQRYFHSTEAEHIRKATDCGKDLKLFFDIWSARESYAKYTGAGVFALDKQFSSLHPPVPLYPIFFRPGYSLTVCTAL